MFAFNFFPYLKYALLLLLLFICCFYCFYIIKNEDAVEKTQQSEEQADTGYDIDSGRCESAESNRTGSKFEFSNCIIMPPESQNRSTIIQDDNSNLTNHKIILLKEPYSTKFFDSVEHIEECRQGSSTRKIEHLEKETGKGCELCSSEYKNTNVAIPVIKRRSNDKRDAPKESNASLSQKLTKAPLNGYQKSEMNYDLPEIISRDKHLNLSGNDDLVKAFFFGLLQLSHFNEFLNLANKCEPNYFKNTLVTIGEDSSMENEYCALSYCLEFVRRYFNKKSDGCPLMKRNEIIYIGDYFLVSIISPVFFWKQFIAFSVWNKNTKMV